MVMVILTIYGIFMVIMMRQLNVFWQFQFVRIIWNVYLKSRMCLRVSAEASLVLELGLIRHFLWFQELVVAFFCEDCT